MSEELLVACLAFAAVALVAGLCLVGWRDWLRFARDRLARDAGDGATMATLTIELAALRERVRRIEARLPRSTARG